MKVTFIERSPRTWRLRIENGVGPDGRRLFKYETLRGTSGGAASRSSLSTSKAPSQCRTKSPSARSSRNGSRRGARSRRSRAAPRRITTRCSATIYKRLLACGCNGSLRRTSRQSTPAWRGAAIFHPTRCTMSMRLWARRSARRGAPRSSRSTLWRKLRRRRSSVPSLAASPRCRRASSWRRSKAPGWSGSSP
jgi:hypothetical protein